MYNLFFERFLMKMRLQITMQDDLIKKIDNYASSLGISRSSAISVLCSQSLQMSSSIDTMNTLLSFYQEQQEQKE